jgi:hypothetical protein
VGVAGEERAMATLESLANELKCAYEICEVKRADLETARNVFEKARDTLNAAHSDWNIAHRALIDFIEGKSVRTEL